VEKRAERIGDVTQLICRFGERFLCSQLCEVYGTQGYPTLGDASRYCDPGGCGSSTALLLPSALVVTAGSEQEGIAEGEIGLARLRRWKLSQGLQAAH
jgi:hypothetical protein